MENELLSLSRDGFETYGRYITADTVAGQTPDSADGFSAYRQGIDCSELQSGELAVGFLSVFQRKEPIYELERHNRYGEIFTCVKGEGVLPVCKGEKPVRDSVKFYRVCAGDVILLRRGIWHCPPIPRGGCGQIDFMMFLPADILNDIEKICVDVPIDTDGF